MSIEIIKKTDVARLHQFFLIDIRLDYLTESLSRMHHNIHHL